MHHNNNPYAQAAGAYGSTASTGDQRTLEANVLLNSAAKLDELAKKMQNGDKVPLHEIDNVLTHNRKIWELFANDIKQPEHPMPKEIKSNIISLAYYVFKTTLEILCEQNPEKIKSLMRINRTIAAGLMKKPEPQASPMANAKPVRNTAPETVKMDSIA